MTRDSSQPPEPNDDDDSAIREMLSASRIAIVGASDDPSRASHQIASYLLAHNKKIVPVNPNHDEVLGLKCYRSLSDIPGPVQLVNVFRRPEFCADVAREAIGIGATGIWLQSGIVSPDAEKLTRNAGILFVQDRCIMVEHIRRSQS